METIYPIPGKSIDRQSIEIGKKVLIREPISEYSGKVRAVTIKGFIGNKVWVESPYVGTQVVDVEDVFNLR